METLIKRLKQGGWLPLDWWLAQFHKEVQKRAKDIDPSSEQDWYSLTLGWAIAKGMTPGLANAFACFVRYQTSLA